MRHDQSSINLLFTFLKSTETNLLPSGDVAIIVRGGLWAWQGRYLFGQGLDKADAVHFRRHMPRTVDSGKMA